MVTLNISNFEEEAWFIFRTHGESIKRVEGAEYEEIEEDAYLITATDSNVRLELQEAQERFYYFAGK